jgi:hypothetical protein
MSEHEIVRQHTCSSRGDVRPIPLVPPPPCVRSIHDVEQCMAVCRTPYCTPLYERMQCVQCVQCVQCMVHECVVYGV